MQRICTQNEDLLHFYAKHNNYMQQLSIDIFHGNCLTKQYFL